MGATDSVVTKSLSSKRKWQQEVSQSFADLKPHIQELVQSKGKELQKLLVTKNNFYIRGNRIWGARAKCAKIVRVVQGNSWEMTFTPQVGNDMAAISDYVSVETI